MVNVSITRLSSKGQIIIPSEMRKDLKERDEFLILKDGHRIILNSVKKLTEEMRDDLEFARRTEEAWQRIDNGEYIEMPVDKFLEELEKW